jgi:hypothetical protein
LAAEAKAHGLDVKSTPSMITKSIAPLLLVALAGAGCSGSSGPAARAPESTSRSDDAAPLFRFHVDFWANLNQVLLHEALVPRERREGPKSLKGRHVVGVETLTPAETAVWQASLAHYDASFTTPNLFDHFIASMPALLAVGESQTPPVTNDLDERWRRSLVDAGPIYRAHFWPDHARRDREYIARMQPLVAAHGAWFARRLVAVYGMPLPAKPIDVEITPVVPPYGGFTQGEPPYDGTNAALITLSSEDPSYAGETGVEMLFHEVSHLIVGRVEKGLEEAAKRRHTKLPPRLWHDVVFYTAGHVAQERLGPSYVPYAERASSRLFADDDERLQVLQRAWQPYLDGRVTMDAAIDAIAASFPNDAPPPPTAR